MTLKDTIGAVEEFHEAFGIGNNYSPTADLSDADVLLRYKLMREENEEYLEENTDHLRLQMDEDVREEILEENGLSRFYTDPNFDNNRKKEYF